MGGFQQHRFSLPVTYAFYNETATKESLSKNSQRKGRVACDDSFLRYKEGIPTKQATRNFASYARATHLWPRRISGCHQIRLSCPCFDRLEAVFAGG